MRLYSIYLKYASTRDKAWAASIASFFSGMLLLWYWLPIDPAIIRYILTPIFIGSIIITAFPMLVFGVMSCSNIRSPAEALRYAFVYVVRVEDHWYVDCLLWSRENNIKDILRFVIDDKIYFGFKKKDDAVLFKLSWAFGGE